MRFRILMAMGLALLGACAADTSNQGYTSCGDFPSGPVECQPGQYCADATFSECVPGCTSDVNCAAEQSCRKPPGESVGDCVNDAPPTTDPPVTDPPVTDPPAWEPACRDTCQNAAFFCEDGSITAPMAAACDAWCRDVATSDGERQTFVACVEAAFSTAAICDEAGCLP